MQGLLCCLIGFWLLCKYFAWEILEIEGLVILCCFFGHPHCLLCSSQEFEEEQEEEWKTFLPAPRYTEADELNDLKSLQRKLQETLVLLVKKEKDSPSWEPPLAEVMFDTSETLQQVYEGNLLIQIWGPFLERPGNLSRPESNSLNYV